MDDRLKTLLAGADEVYKADIPEPSQILRLRLSSSFRILHSIPNFFFFPLLRRVILSLVSQPVTRSRWHPKSA